MTPERGVQPGRAALEIVRAITRLDSVPLVPEVRIYQASDPIRLWEDTERATGVSGLDPPFWAFAWAGGQALARYVLDRPQIVRGRRVLDLASGSGLVAIAAVKAGAAAVTACDIDPLAVAAISLNAGANGVTVSALSADIMDDGGTTSADAQVVLVADAFYERDLAGRVTRFMQQARARGAVILAGDFGRTYLPRDQLVALAAYDVSGLRVLEGSDIKHTTVWTLRD
jgi:predicted nicotinamide N-methyase